MKNENNTKSTISVKPETKEKFLKHLEKINQERSSKSKIYANDWLTFVMDNMPEPLRESIKSHKMTILDEQLRIRFLYEKENGLVDNEKWELLKISGVLKSFFKKHSKMSIDIH
jgi:ubiquitin C-terminal hydrolase